MDEQHRDREDGLQAGLIFLTVQHTYLTPAHLLVYQAPVQATLQQSPEYNSILPDGTVLSRAQLMYLPCRHRRLSLVYDQTAYRYGKAMR